MQALCSLRPWVLGPDLTVLYQINTHKSVMSKPSYLLISYCSDNFYLKGQSVYWDTELFYWSHLHILWMNTAILFDVQGRGLITCQYDQRLACLWICSDLHLVNRKLYSPQMCQCAQGADRPGSSVYMHSACTSVAIFIFLLCVDSH